MTEQDQQLKLSLQTFFLYFLDKVLYVIQSKMNDLSPAFKKKNYFDNWYKNVAITITTQVILRDCFCHLKTKSR